MKSLCLLLVAATLPAHAADSILAPGPSDYTLRLPTGCFEVRARKNIQIERLQLGVTSNAFPVIIQYKPDTYVGFEDGSGPWVEIYNGYGSAVSLNVPSYPIVLRHPVRILAGERISLRITSTGLFSFVVQGSAGPFATNEDLILWGGVAVGANGVVPNRRIWGIFEYSHFVPDPEPTPTPTPEPTPAPEPTLTVFGPNRITTRRNAVALQGSAPHARYVTATYNVRRKSGKRRTVTVVGAVDAAGIFKVGVNPRGAATRVWLTAFGDEGKMSKPWSVRILPSAKAKKRR